MLRRRLLVSAGLLLSLAWFADRGTAQPPAKDQHGDKLPPGAVGRLGTIRWRHDDVIFFAAFLPDGKSVVSVGVDQTVRVWEFPSGIQLRRIDLATGKKKRNDFIFGDPVAASLSPDGKIIATYISDGGFGGRPQVQLHDVATGKKHSSLKAGDNEVSNLFFSPNGKHLSASDLDGNITIWDWTTGKQVGTVKAATKNPLAFDRDPKPIFSYSPDGNSLIVVNLTNSLSVIDVPTGKEPLSSQGASGPVLGIQYEQDGKHLLTYSGGITSKWEVASGKNLGPIAQKKSKNLPFMPRAKISPNGAIIVGIRPAPGRIDFNNPKAFVVIVDADSGIEVGKHQLESSKFTLSTELTFSPDGKTLIAHTAAAKKIELLEVPTARLLRTLDISADVPPAAKGQQEPFFKPTNILVSPDGKTLVTSFDRKNFVFWNLKSGDRVGRLALPANKTAIEARFLGDSRCLMLSMTDGTVEMYEVASGTLRRAYGKKASKKNIGDAEFDRDDDDYPLGGARIQSARIAFSPDGQCLGLAGLDRKVHVWHVATTKELAAYSGHSAAINSIAFSPDAKTIASASSDTTVLIWDLTKLNRPKANVKPQAGDLERWWEALAVNDAAKAFDAICDLSAAPKEAVAFIKERVKPAAAVEMKHIEELVGQLNDTQYKVREKANSELSQIGERIVPALDKALAANPPLEAKRRLEDLRGKLTGMVLQGDRLRLFRAIEVLERIGSPEARQVLESLAAGAPGALGTTSAQAALKRF